MCYHIGFLSDQSNIYKPTLCVGAKGRQSLTSEEDGLQICLMAQELTNCVDLTKTSSFSAFRPTT